MPTKREQFAQSVRAQLLGQQMRDLRDTHGKTLKFIADYLGVEFSTLARYERAEWPFQRQHVMALLDVYGVYDEQDRQELEALAMNAWRTDHWYRDWAKPDPLDGPEPDLRWLHNRAERICVYSPTVIPELLQDHPYAEVILGRARPGKLDDDQLEKHLYGITDLAKSITRRGDPAPVGLHAIVDEQVLHRLAGGPSVHKAQLEYLLDMSRHSNVDIQVVTGNARVHGGIFGPFTVYRLPVPYPPVASVDHLGGTLLIEAGGAEQYSAVFDTLAREYAEPASNTADLIKAVLVKL